MVEGWIGAGAAPDPAERAERAPSTAVSTAHSALGAVRRRQVGVGEVTVLLAPATRGWVREADAAATAAGRDLAVGSCYRTYAEQAALYEDYLNGTGNLAAPPGHSTHGLGLSADIKVTDPATLRWLHAHAKTYGFVKDVPSEAWHWTWRP
jgi:hypothetical protein